MNFNIITNTNLAECHTQWGEDFFNNNNCLAQHQEEPDPMSQDLMFLELETLDHIPDEATILAEDDIFASWDFSAATLQLENLTSPSLPEEPLSEISGREERKRTKRRVGRPARTELRSVTQLPTGIVSETALEMARYRRMRDLNNIASQKCRLKK